MKMIWCEWKIEENCHVLVNQFHGHFHSKTLCCRKIYSVFRDVNWWRLKGLKRSNFKLKITIWSHVLYKKISEHQGWQHIIYSGSGGESCPVLVCTAQLSSGELARRLMSGLGILSLDLWGWGHVRSPPGHDHSTGMDLPVPTAPAQGPASLELRLQYQHH